MTYSVLFIGSIGSVSVTLPFTRKNKVGDVEFKDTGNRTQELKTILEVFCQFSSISETAFDSEELKKMSKSVQKQKEWLSLSVLVNKSKQKNVICLYFSYLWKLMLWTQTILDLTSSYLIENSKNNMYVRTTKLYICTISNPFPEFFLYIIYH